MLEEADNMQSSRRTEGRRSAEEIRRDIDEKKEVITEAVNRLGQRIHEKVDWRGQVRKHPFLALGAAAGVGFLASGIFRRRANPLEQVAAAIHDLSTRNSGRSIIKMTLLGLATKAATEWINTRLEQHRSDTSRLTH
ncbi:hypothetical protein [Desulfomonile tiedjei]|uniref:DUF3618 domain-containing protein n=1 Tax=Desulfomonile tiedjei (strain ATCC 49306 / DSM 6799 / DCB-1) TaxID=706587 RepID=I4C3E5_DESTA|nr:hypothetical protein [Desulfomonile tiedjei]AFM24086.1 hypothetical protein Desti_1374 [Desulfomonile tiedjei DSM 6799]